MKKIRYNSWIARNFLCEGYETITLAAWVCTKCKSKEEMPQSTRNHECTHTRQWVECMLASGVIIWASIVSTEAFLFGVYLGWLAKGWSDKHVS